MKKILIVVGIFILGMSVVGCKDHTESRMDYTKPVIEEHCNSEIVE